MLQPFHQIHLAHDLLSIIIQVIQLNPFDRHELASSEVKSTIDYSELAFPNTVTELLQDEKSESITIVTQSD